MAINPITGRGSNLSSIDYINTAKTTNLRTKQSGDTLEAVSDGYRGINQRRNGMAKNVSFHVANALTFGIVGQVGKLCANSSRMGSQRDAGMWNAMVKDFGQTYQNATNARESGAFLSNAARIWTNGLGTVTTVGTGMLGRLLQNTSHNLTINREFGNTLQREFGMQRNYNVVKNLNSDTVKNTEKQVYRQLNNELNEANESARNQPGNNPLAANNRDYIRGPVRAATSSGSEGLQSAFAIYSAKKEFTIENAHFLNWTGPVLDKLDPQSIHHDQHYTLSKMELFTAQQQFVQAGSRLEINLSHHLRGNVDRDFTARLGNYPARLQQAEQTFNANPTPDNKQALEDIKNERFTQNESQQLLPSLRRADAEIVSLTNGTLRNFQNAVSNKLNELEN